MQLDYTFDRQIELEREDAREEGREEGLEEGLEEGRKEGIKLKLKNIIHSMYDKNYTVEQISDVVELSTDQVKTILGIN